METKIGEMDKKDYMVIGGIALVSLTGVILIGIQIKKLGDRKRLLASQVNNEPHTKFDGTDVNCIGCDGSQNCSGCTKFSNASGVFKMNRTECDNSGNWWDGRCHPIS